MIVTASWVPASTVPRGQDTTPSLAEHVVPPPELPETNETPGGRSSLTVTSVACDGPALRATSV
jgi:hypothetical protein